MQKIKLLSKNLINKISAGEVLERPASAVKELIENSIDANSKNIKIEIRNGGKSEITVTDDGHGIKSIDLNKALIKHTTSKLNENNLNKIKTLGFRGEALSSMGAVSNMKISSRTKTQDLGYEILVEYGEISDIKPINHKKGTKIIIRDIFFSTPARLKFLKSAKYESFIIKKLVQKLALSNTSINFKLLIDGKIILKTTNNKEINFENLLESRVRDFFGENFLFNFLKLDNMIDSIHLKGLIGLPTFHNSNKSNQFIFVNNRVINDNAINQSVRFAYRDLISYDRHPQIILFISLPYEDVDINVHPTKSEVRFKDINFIRKVIIKSLKDRLSDAGHLATNTNTQRTIDTLKKNIQIPINLSYEKEKIEIKQISSLEDQPSKKNLFKEELSLNPLGFAKAQYHQNYIIAQSQSGIILVDQHAAHERIVYEKLKKLFYSKIINTQILLIPEIIKLDRILISLVEEKKEYLKQFGLFLEKFGSDSIVVREIPSILTGCNISQLTLDIVNEISEIGSSELLEERINKICSTMACHGSIRSGRDMEIEEMNNLLRSMENTPFSGQCNHGRPTYIELKIEDIEKLFGRK